MQKEIVIVTSFFSINREEWKGFRRTDQQYFEYFKVWAHMQNRLIVYLENEELGRKVMAFRQEIGLGERTTVVLVPNIMEVDQELYASIQSVTSNPKSRLFRFQQRNPEVWNAAYIYIITMKMWCGQDAMKRGLVQSHDMLAWMDFGFNHGEATYLNTSNFSFLWQYDFPEKMNLFSIQPIDDRPIFEIVNSLDAYIMAGIFAGPAGLWQEFWLMCRQNMMELVHCGLVDDEQTLMLMCVRQRPDMFTVTLSDWNLGLWQSGAQHLILKPHKTGLLAWLSRVNHRRLDLTHVLQCLCRMFRYYLTIPFH